MTAELSGADVAALRSRCRGPVLPPGEKPYERGRRVWNAAVDRRPAVIVRCEHDTDIMAGVRFAAERGLEVSVRGGGHSIGGHGVADGAVMLDLAAMRQVVVDAERRRAVVRPGVTWGELDRATQHHGLAVTGADVSTVGVIGALLAGGCGWLHRLAGLTCDALVRAEVVTADGTMAAASPESHAELFWALRGGGGNFGVVASAELDLVPVPPVYGGTVLYPLGQARRVLATYRSLCATAPDHLSLQAALLRWPPGEPKGPPVVAVSATHFGPAERAAEAVRPLREIGVPELDLFRPLSYVELQGQSEQAFPAGYGTATGTEWLRELDDAAIEALVAMAERMPTPFSMISLHQLGGAMSRVGVLDTAFSHREAAQHLAVFSSWPAGAPPEPSRRWTREVVAAVKASSAGGPYLALLDGDAAPERVRDAYHPAAYERLTRVKRRYDPANLFRVNHNIPPAGAAQ